MRAAMRADEAYPLMPNYDSRAMQRFSHGDRVTVGPGYRMGGTYQSDGFEGEYFVVRVCLSGKDYGLARHPQEDERFTVSGTRLQRVAPAAQAMKEGK